MTIAVRAAVLSTLSLLLAGTATAQLISIRTVPVAQDDQFAIFPSQTLGMGGVSLAVADTLRDPFANPATAARLSAGRVFGSPSLYTVSSQAGEGRSIPLGAFLRAGGWFAGLAAALQEVEPAGQEPVFQPPILAVAPPNFAPQQLSTVPDRRAHGNEFVVAMLGRTLNGTGLSLAAGLSYANLRAVDGVDLLYAGSRNVGQSGSAVDLRLGLLREWEGGRSLEAVLVHNRFGMTHDVTYADLVWDPATQTPIEVPRLERNLDHTNTWGAHVEYERPLTAEWRLGLLATANRMSHPKIPNYAIMNIPRDPGHSSAFNVGLGVSRRQGRDVFAVEAVYEPIWSTTWAEAASPTPTGAGDTIPTGGRTIENTFRFNNAWFRMGLENAIGGAASFQLGLMLHSIGYRLTQVDNVQGTGRTQDERWLEWAPTWGLRLRFPTLEIHYQGRVTQGTGRPGVSQSCFNCRVAPASGGIIVAPSGPLSLTEVSVFSHQVSISLPLR